MHLFGFSTEFINIAKNWLKKYEDKVTYIKSDICGDWELKIKSTLNIIISSLTIHNLLNENKKDCTTNIIIYMKIIVGYSISMKWKH